ncbi:MAG: hypothetical protein QXN34_07000 [Archaeoglobaceae archaeon]
MPFLKKKEEEKEQQLETEQQAEAWAGPQWEYRTEMLVGFGGKFVMDKLNELGAQGWEAVSAFYDAKHSQTYVLLKRTKQSAKT